MKNLFEQSFGRLPRVTAMAHGRVNLIGEHTDYNDGFVLPSAIPQQTQVALSPRQDENIYAVSRDADAQLRHWEYTLSSEKPAHQWGDYLMGVTKLLRADGHKISGCDIAITSNVPMGSGLSSSAAFEVALIRAFRTAFQLEIDDLTLARLCQRVENEFVGAKVGIMDPMACSLSDEGSALFIDTRALTYERIALPTEKMALVVIHSGVAHQNVHGGYNRRRAECEEACRLLGVASLRDLTLYDATRYEALPSPLNRRVRHVVTENARVLSTVDALRKADAKTVGELFYASHASMRDDYEVSVPEIDQMVTIAQQTPKVWGARLTGGGFGGSVVIAVQPGATHEVARAIADRYAEETRQNPVIVVPPPS